MRANDVMIGWTTVARREDALRLAEGLVEARLAACTQVSGPVASIYRWEGRVERAEEYRVAVKFAAARRGDVGAWIARHHPYEMPQWIACEAAAGAEKYLNWVVENST